MRALSSGVLHSPTNAGATMQATRAATAALLLFVQNSTFPHSTVAPVLYITRNDEVRALSSGVPHSPTTRGGDQATPTATAGGGWCSFRMAQVLKTRPAVAPVLSHLVPHDDDHGTAVPSRNTR